MEGWGRVEGWGGVGVEGGGVSSMEGFGVEM